MLSVHSNSINPFHERSRQFAAHQHTEQQTQGCYVATANAAMLASGFKDQRALTNTTELGSNQLTCIDACMAYQPASSAAACNCVLANSSHMATLWRPPACLMAFMLLPHAAAAAVGSQPWQPKMTQARQGWPLHGAQICFHPRLSMVQEHLHKPCAEGHGTGGGAAARGGGSSGSTGAAAALAAAAAAAASVAARPRLARSCLSSSSSMCAVMPCRRSTNRLFHLSRFWGSRAYLLLWYLMTAALQVRHPCAALSTPSVCLEAL